jgi:hypothetical protein
MKKIVLLFAMMLMSISGFAQAEEIINSYKNNPGIQMIELNQGMLEMMASAAKTDEEKEALKSVEGMTMGMISSDELVPEIIGKLEVLESKGYGRINVNKDETQATVFVKKDGDFITEIVMIAKARGHNVLVLMKGKFSADQMESLIKR